MRTLAAGGVMVLSVVFLCVGCSLVDSEHQGVIEETTDEEIEEPVTIQFEDPAACIRPYRPSQDTTAVVGSWTLVEVNSNAWTQECWRYRGEDLNGQVRSLTFYADGLMSRDGSDWYPYRFSPAAGEWLFVEMQGSLGYWNRTGYSVQNDTLILDYRATDGDQLVYVRDRLQRRVPVADPR